jgi:uncharacterized membrane protein YfcA
MSMVAADSMTIAAGGLVGAILGLIGGGGSVLAVPLLVYGVGVASPQVAIGTSAFAVSVSAFTNLITHWRAGNVSWPCAGVFSLAGAVGALMGSSVAKAIDGQRLLALFGALMIVVGLAMLRNPTRLESNNVHLTFATAGRLLPALVVTGLGVGLVSGFFGIGGGFLIVPGLMAATGLPITKAIGTSLVSVTVFGATTAANYAVSGLIDWRVAILFISGGVIGGLIGVASGNSLSRRKGALRLIFGVTAVVVGLYVSARGVLTLIHS